MTKRYSDYVKTGDMKPEDAIKHQSIRDASKRGMHETLKTLAGQGLPADAAAFGALDIIAVKLVEWYGAKAANEVFAHYGAVCARQDKKGGEAK